MGDDGGDLSLGHAVILRVLQVIAEGRIGNARGHQRYNGDDALGFDVKRFLVPDLAEQHIVVEMGEHRRKFSKLCTPRRLRDFLAHIASPFYRLMYCKSFSGRPFSSERKRSAFMCRSYFSRSAAICPIIAEAWCTSMAA